MRAWNIPMFQRAKERPQIGVPAGIWNIPNVPNGERTPRFLARSGRSAAGWNMVMFQGAIG
jgi:hypothetical protein